MLSVIIPTYNRLEKLQKTLRCLAEQTLSKENFEVIVVDDGSTDGTKDFMENSFSSKDLSWKYFSLQHGGPGKARNLGIEKSSGDLILFCGDDTHPAKDLLEIHKKHHENKSGTALLGIALWNEEEKTTQYMHYLAPAGPQFHYNTIKDTANAGFDHFYTCNISLAKKWLVEEKFDERFVNGAFEDIELGLRLEKKGLKIFFEKSAKVFHSHYYDEENFSSRMEKVGRAFVLFLNKYRQDNKTFFLLKRKYAPFLFFPGIKLFLFMSQVMAESKLVKSLNLRYHWFWQICFSYAKGIDKEKRDFNHSIF